MEAKTFFIYKTFIYHLILWNPKRGTAEVGRHVKTYNKLLTEDTGLKLEDLHKTMDDRAL